MTRSEKNQRAADTIRALMAARRWTARDLARATGLTIRTLYNVLSARNTRQQTRDKIANAFGFSAPSRSFRVGHHLARETRFVVTEYKRRIWLRRLWWKLTDRRPWPWQVNRTPPTEHERYRDDFAEALLFRKESETNE